jgi:hypothetical protein
MPRIFANIESALLPALEQTLLVSQRAILLVQPDPPRVLARRSRRTVDAAGAAPHQALPKGQEAMRCSLFKRAEAVIRTHSHGCSTHYPVFRAVALDFILNYNLKYRLGRDAEKQEE